MQKLRLQSSRGSYVKNDSRTASQKHYVMKSKVTLKMQYLHGIKKNPDCIPASHLTTNLSFLSAFFFINDISVKEKIVLKNI